MSQPLFSDNFQAGLTHMGYQFFDSSMTAIGSRITASVLESSVSPGSYYVTSPTTPANAWGVHWNDSVATDQKANQFFDFMGNVNPLSSGSGPKAVTLHFTDDSAVALGWVAVNVTDNTGASVATGTTDGSGNLVVGLLASTAYTIISFRLGYTSTPSTQTTSAGNGSQTLTFELTANAIIPPANIPSQCNVGGTITDAQGNPLNGVVVKLQLVSPTSARPLVAGGGAVEVRVVEVTTGDGLYQDGVTPWPDGYCEAQVTRNDQITPTGTTWSIRSDDGGSLNTTGKVLNTASLNFIDL